MATITDITTRPASGVGAIDALIGSSQPWNFIGRNVIYYTFSVGSGVEATSGALDVTTRTAFNATQAADTRIALNYVSQVTGIQFAETADGNQADFHFANANLFGQATGLTSNAFGYQYMGNTVTSVTVDSWIYLDSFDQVFTNQAPAPGSIGYETLLHEIGHALGLKHPFDSPNILSPGLAFGQDNAGTSIMSYTSDGTIHRTFSPYDLAALDWLYGRDGLGGNYGVGSPGKYIEGGVASESFSGGAGDDFLAGNGGNDAINGGAGTDTAMYTGNRNQYAITKAGGAVTVVDKFATEGTDALTSIERLQFSDMSVNLQVGDISRALGTPLTNALVELYTAYLNRTPDADGMAYWMNQLLAGQSLGSIGDGFYSSAVYFGNLTGYSVNTTNADFVTTVYKNVLGRSSVDAQGLAYWTNELATGHQTRANLVSSILGSAHTFKGDATYGWVADLLDNKIAVGKAVAIDAGLVYNTSEASITKGMAIEAAVTPTSTAAAISLVGVTDPLHLLG